jgi:hypothetical protein
VAFNRPGLLYRPLATRARVLGPATIAAAAIVARALPATAETTDPAAMLQASVEKLAELTSYRFRLETVDGVTRFLDVFELHDIEGEVVRPDSFAARGTIKVVFAELEVAIVSIGDQLWVSDPMSGDGSMVDASALISEAGLDPTFLLNPERLLVPAIGFLKEPEVLGETDLDGKPVTLVVGRVDLDAALGDFGTPIAQAGLTLPDDVPVSVYIDENGLPVRIEIVGPILPAEPAGIVRRLDLYDFDAAIEIVAPA